MARTTTMTAGDANKIVAGTAGAILLVVGLWGFATDMILGLFAVNATHNFIHLLTGAALLAVAFIQNGTYARVTLLTFGVVYAIVALGGFIAEPVIRPFLTNDPAVSLMADHVLHVLLAAVFLIVPLAVKGETRRPYVRGPQA